MFMIYSNFFFLIIYISVGKVICLQCRRPGFDPWVGKIPWRRKWQPTPVFLPGESHGQGNLVDCSPWGCKESGTTERLTHTYRIIMQIWLNANMWGIWLKDRLESFELFLQFFSTSGIF